MERLGWIPKRPQMVAAQAVRANAVTSAWREKRPIEPIKIGYTVAEGLSAGDPGKKGAWTLALLREHGGIAGDAEDEQILEAQRLLARTEGIWAGPTGVATLAVLCQLLDQKAIDPDATICVILSETGLKTEAPHRAVRVAFDEASPRRLVNERLGTAKTAATPRALGGAAAPRRSRPYAHRAHADPFAPRRAPTCPTVPAPAGDRARTALLAHFEGDSTTGRNRVPPGYPGGRGRGSISRVWRHRAARRGRPSGTAADGSPVVPSLP
jgi:hypothetical protein